MSSSIDVERWIYMTAFEDMAKKVDLPLALSLRAQWSGNSKGKNMAAAACHYLTYYVIPAMAGNRNDNPIPRWVQEILLCPPTEPTDIASFLRLFDSNWVEGLNERVRGSGRVLGPFWTSGAPSVESLRDENMGVYFTPNPIDGEEVSEKGSRRLDANVKRFSACFADFDGGDKFMQMAVIGMYCPEPSIIVESKNGYHVYFMLADDVTEREWRLLQDGIITKCGSDKAVRNPSRLMRLPFTYHCKTDDKFLVRIASFKWKRFTKRELAEAFGVDLEPQKARYTGTYSGPRAVRVPNVGSLSAGTRHPTLMEEAARAYAGVPEGQFQTVREMLVFWYSRVCIPLKKDWEKEVNEVCDFLERRQAGGIISNRTI
jgi:hypothetical protein